MSLPQLPPKDGNIYSLYCYNQNTWWQKTGSLNQSDTQTPQKKNKKLLIIAGQSNAAGTTLKRAPEEHYQPHPSIKQISRGVTKTFGLQPIHYNPGAKGSIIPAQNPLQHLGISDVNAIGCWKTLCDDYLKDHPNDEIYLLPAALGGTSFAPSSGYVITWDKSINWAHLNLYNEMIKDANNFLSSNEDVEVMGCFWIQGESDTGVTWDYANKLDTLVKNMRTDLHAGKGQNMPFVCGTMLKSWRDLNPMAEWINTAHRQIGNRVPNTACANFDNVQTGVTADGLNVHYDMSGQIQLGHVFYQTFKTLTSQSRSQPNSRSLDLSNVPDDRSLGLHEDMSFEEVCRILAQNEGKVVENE